jgi:hypothetical protein
MNITAIDIAIVAIMGLALIRGVFVGMIREGFSVAAIGAVVLGAVYGAGPTGAWLDNASAGEIGGSAAKVLGGIFAGVLAGVLVGALGRYLRRGARIVGLGMADRIGGGAIGAAEGALVGRGCAGRDARAGGRDAHVRPRAPGGLQLLQRRRGRGDEDRVRDGHPASATGPAERRERTAAGQRELEVLCLSESLRWKREAEAEVPQRSEGCPMLQRTASGRR